MAGGMYIKFTRYGWCLQLHIHVVYIH